MTSPPLRRAHSWLLYRRHSESWCREFRFTGGGTGAELMAAEARRSELPACVVGELSWIGPHRLAASSMGGPTARHADYLKGTETGPGTLENTAMKSRS